MPSRAESGTGVAGSTVTALSVAALSIGGCALKPFTPQPPALPAAYQTAGSSRGGDTAGVFASFGCPDLDALLASAVHDGVDVAAAIARVRQADARARQAGAAILPQVDAGAGGTQYAGGARGATAHELDWSALLSASYELDFWGKNRAARDALLATAAASRAGLATVRITLSVAIASTYFQLQSVRERSALARLNLKTATDLLTFIRSRYDAGLLAPAELAAQRAAVANVQLILPELEQQETEALATLAVLTGRAPEGFSVPARSLEQIAEPAISAGLPAELLRRRPDVVAAEDNLRAAHADLIAARAAMFPSLTLTAAAGVQNPAVNAAVITLAGTGYALTAGADVAQTIFDNGRRRAVTREAEAREEELVAGYRGAVLSALSDVETALAQVEHLDAQQQAERDNVEQSERAFDGARLRYREGSAEFVTVLEAQRILYAAREQMSLYRLARLQALLGLYKALGGGWQASDVAAPRARSGA